jgi:hypothetical protein
MCNLAYEVRITPIEGKPKKIIKSNFQSTKYSGMKLEKYQ